MWINKEIAIPGILINRINEKTNFKNIEFVICSGIYIQINRFILK